MDGNRDGRLSRDEVRIGALQSGWAVSTSTATARWIDVIGICIALAAAHRTAWWPIDLVEPPTLRALTFMWRYDKSLPNVPSPLFYQGVLYMLEGRRDSYVPRSRHRQGAEAGQIDRRAWRLLFVAGSRRRQVVRRQPPRELVAIRAGEAWDVISVTDMGEDTFATPAVADGRLYVRTIAALYCLQWQK